MASTSTPIFKQPFITPKVVTTSRVLTGTDSGTCWQNTGATGPVTMTLPKAFGNSTQGPSGLQFSFIIGPGGQNIVIQPKAGDTIRGLTAGTAFTIPGAGDTGAGLTLICIIPGFWDTIWNIFPNGLLAGPGGSVFSGPVTFNVNPVQPNIQNGTFVGTLTGCTTAPTATFHYTIANNICTVSMANGANLTGTSNSTSMTITGLPAACQPATQTPVIPCVVEDNGLLVLASAEVNPGLGTIIFLCANVAGTKIQYTGTGFTAGGTKGMDATAITYSLQ